MDTPGEYGFNDISKRKYLEANPPPSFAFIPRPQCSGGEFISVRDGEEGGGGGVGGHKHEFPPCSLVLRVDPVTQA